MIHTIRIQARVVLLAASCAGAGVAHVGGAVSGAAQEGPPTTLSSGDDVARLNGRLAAGTAELHFEAGAGYLRSLLAALEVGAESQALVFSQTSAQFRLISPARPRAVYFSDTAAVGWVPGADVLELAAHDPTLGYVFYTLRQASNPKPRAERQESCLACHRTAETLAVPGPLVLSTFPMADDPNAYASGVNVDHRTPFRQRWGGWYVTGDAVTPEHLGNRPVVISVAELQRPQGPAPRFRSVANVVDVENYLTPCSDVAALMVLDHQSHMANLITRLAIDSRHEPFAAAAVSEDVRELVDYLLFVDETPVPTPMAGSCGFAERFMSRGPRDRRGRSLRSLNLATRLFHYRCSYMIYSAPFNALTAAAREAVYGRMWEVLSGADTNRAYRDISRQERLAIVEILRDTKTDLPLVFNQPVR